MQSQGTTLEEAKEVRVSNLLGVWANSSKVGSRLVSGHATRREFDAKGAPAATAASLANSWLQQQTKASAHPVHKGLTVNDRFSAQTHERPPKGAGTEGLRYIFPTLEVNPSSFQNGSFRKPQTQNSLSLQAITHFIMETQGRNHFKPHAIQRTTHMRNGKVAEPSSPLSRCVTLHCYCHR